MCAILPLIAFGVEIQTVFETTDYFKRKKWILTVAFIASKGCENKLQSVFAYLGVFFK